MYEDVLFSLYIPRVGERLLCFSHTTGKRTKTDFVLSCLTAPKFPGSDCYLIQTLNGLRYVVLVHRAEPVLHKPKEVPMSPSKAKAVAATTAFVLPSNGQKVKCFHRTTNPTPRQETPHHFPYFLQNSDETGMRFLTWNGKVVPLTLADRVDKVLEKIYGAIKPATAYSHSLS